VGVVKPRFFVELPLAAGQLLDLPAGPTRHVQVLRLQPGDGLLLFNGGGLDWSAEVLQMGRQKVQLRVGQSLAVDRELPLAVTLALAVPANERMDLLVEKATELGVARIQPLMSSRSVLRLSGERAERKKAHWRAVAIAACEQCGRARVPEILPMQPLGAWLQSLPGHDKRPATDDSADLAQPNHTAGGAASARWLLSLDPGAKPPTLMPVRLRELCVLSGPEGGLSEEEESAALRSGFAPVGLGGRTLRADTAPLSVLAWLSLQATAGAVAAGQWPRQ
jgi:16S rRNA (uracil1498-N3)-methyltransferase